VWPTLHKDPSALTVPPNLPDYERECSSFTWQTARQNLDGLPGGGPNIAHEAVDRHAAGPRPQHEALRFVQVDGSVESLTYAALAERTARFAGLLRALGVRPGARIFSLLGRRPELYDAVLGTLKAGGVFCPLFSAYGPDPLRQRLRLGGSRYLNRLQELLLTPEDL
jgi:acetyl-CoA synthetase